MLLAALLLQAAPPPPGPPNWPTKEQCERVYAPRQTFTGIWVDDFEGQRFFDGLSRLQDLDWRSKHVWIDIDMDDAFRRLRLVRPGGFGHAYRVTVQGEKRINQPPPLCFIWSYDESGRIRNALLLQWEDLGPVR